jgi:hypothetical protein
MTVHIARNDSLIVRQVDTLTPVVVNSGSYKIKLNNKSSTAYVADVTATAQEIVEGVQAILAAYTAAQFPEAKEVVWTEDNAIITATGPTDGMPFTPVDASSGGGAALTVALVTAAKSPNHWIAENFNSGALPVSTDTVYLTQLTKAQSFKWGLDQSGVTLALFDIKADSEAEIGLPEYTVGSTPYYQAAYRDTWLRISATILRIGDGQGSGSGRIKIDLGTNQCDCTIYKTGLNKADQDEASVQLAGSHASNSLQVLGGEVDIAMLPGKTSQWATIVVSGGIVRCGAGVTLAATEVGGSGYLETRTAMTTVKTRDNGRLVHIGSGNITTSLDIAGGNVEVRATGALSIALLNGYGGRILDLSKCDSDVTIANMNVYATPESVFTILDPNNHLVMTNPASTPNGAQSLVIKTGSGRSVKIT